MKWVSRCRVRINHKVFHAQSDWLFTEFSTLKPTIAKFPDDSVDFVDPVDSIDSIGSVDPVS